LLYLFSASSASAHEPILLDVRLATPGPRLELIELPQDTVRPTKKYRLRSVGLPRGVVFNIWAKDFGHSFYEVASGFHIDEVGKLVSINRTGPTSPEQSGELIFSPGPYPRGARWEIAVVSANRKIKTFAKVIPHPIIFRDQTCSIELELLTQRGDRFLATGAGFDRGTDVITALSYAGRVIEKSVRTSGDGKVPPQVFFHAAINGDRSARYTVKGRFCEVSVPYEWGEPALRRH
jgi:hypothetical protein